MTDNLDKEADSLEQEMKKFHVDFCTKAEIAGHRYLGVQCDIDCDVELPEFMTGKLLRKRVERGSVYYVEFESKPGTLTLHIFVKLPEEFKIAYLESKWWTQKFVTAYPDLCWKHANGTTPATLLEVATVFREDDDIMLGDLTWVLPSKFVDDFVEMMHTLNQSIIAGLMQDSLVYGPYITDRY